MAVLSPNQIAALIYFVGGWGPNAGSTGVYLQDGEQHRPPKNDPKRRAYESFLDVAIAVCLSESGGDTLAKNASSSASGLWQILAETHADLIAQESNYVFVEYDQPRGKTKAPSVFDPRVNSMVARDLWASAGKGWSPWEAYTTGSYRKNLGHGKDAYKFITNKKNLEAEQNTFIANIMETENYADLAASVAGGVTGQGLLNAQGWKNMLSSALEFLKDAGVAVGVFVLGAVLLILGVVFMIQRSGAGKKLPGPIGLVSKAVS